MSGAEANLDEVEPRNIYREKAVLGSLSELLHMTVPKASLTRTLYESINYHLPWSPLAWVSHTSNKILTNGEGKRRDCFKERSVTAYHN